MKRCNRKSVLSTNKKCSRKVETWRNRPKEKKQPRLIMKNNQNFRVYSRESLDPDKANSE